MPGLVTVFGGSGFLGRAIVGRLVADGFQVRIAVRQPGKAGVLERLDRAGAVQSMSADIRDEASVAAAVAGARAVVNAVGLYLERGAETFEAVHVRGAEQLARQASRAGVGQLVHTSGIGADPASPSAYVRARAEGEQVVASAFDGATILRPSVLFGPGDSFFNSLADIARHSPLLPLFGRGKTRLQPVYVGDVAEAAARVLAAPAGRGRVYELGGPGTFTYRELVELLLREMALERPLLPLPFAVWDLVAALSAILPSPPVTRDQLALIRQDNVVSPDAWTFDDLGIRPTAVETVLPSYLSKSHAEPA